MIDVWPTRALLNGDERSDRGVGKSIRVREASPRTPGSGVPVRRADEACNASPPWKYDTQGCRVAVGLAVGRRPTWSW